MVLHCLTESIMGCTCTTIRNLYYQDFLADDLEKIMKVYQVSVNKSEVNTHYDICLNKFISSRSKFVPTMYPKYRYIIKINPLRFVQAILHDYEYIARQIILDFKHYFKDSEYVIIRINEGRLNSVVIDEFLMYRYSFREIVTYCSDNFFKFLLENQCFGQMYYDSIWLDIYDRRKYMLAEYFHYDITIYSIHQKKLTIFILRKALIQHNSYLLHLCKMIVDIISFLQEKKSTDFLSLDEKGRVV